MSLFGNKISNEEQFKKYCENFDQFYNVIQEVIKTTGNDHIKILTVESVYDWHEITKIELYSDIANILACKRKAVIVVGVL
jgi:hypothetical protein